MRTAKVYLVGAGPGDPGLLTIKALRVLEHADVVIYDRLVSAEVLALANPAAVFVYAGKAQGQQHQIQNEIYDWILRFAGRANTIVRLKSGDPMVFGRCGEELEFLATHGIEAEVVPGVSSAFAAAAQAGIPLTFRGLAGSFAVIAGHREGLVEQRWDAYAGIDTLVILMGVEYRDIIASSLIEAGRAPDLLVAFVENASTERERITEATLSDVAAGRVEVRPPAVFVIGEVVGLRNRLRMAVSAEVSA